MFRRNKSAALLSLIFSIHFCLMPAGCEQTDNSLSLNVPRGYAPVLELEIEDHLLSFGPFVGYYFKPDILGDFTRLKFVCFNEHNFYTNDIAENAKLYQGEAVLTRLPGVDFKLPDHARINPVFFSDAPSKWLENRPEPKNEFVHFHSCYDSQGPVLTGYWMRHVGVDEFRYDMGGRVGPDSPLYHKLTPGIDKAFARIIEFDRGPE
jgi:hypothetical protein